MELEIKIISTYTWWFIRDREVFSPNYAGKKVCRKQHINILLFNHTEISEGTVTFHSLFPSHAKTNESPERKGKTTRSWSDYDFLFCSAVPFSFCISSSISMTEASAACCLFSSSHLFSWHQRDQWSFRLLFCFEFSLCHSKTTTCCSIDHENRQTTICRTKSVKVSRKPTAGRHPYSTLKER